MDEASNLSKTQSPRRRICLVPPSSPSTLDAHELWLSSSVSHAESAFPGLSAGSTSTNQPLVRYDDESNCDDGGVLRFKQRLSASQYCQVFLAEWTNPSGPPRMVIAKSATKSKVPLSSVSGIAFSSVSTTNTHHAAGLHRSDDVESIGVKRLRREAKIMERLQPFWDKCVPKSHGLFAWQQGAVLIMDYIKGKPVMGDWTAMPNEEK